MWLGKYPSKARDISAQGIKQGHLMVCYSGNYHKKGTACETPHVLQAVSWDRRQLVNEIFNRQHAAYLGFFCQQIRSTEEHLLLAQVWVM